MERTVSCYVHELNNSMKKNIIKLSYRNNMILVLTRTFVVIKCRIVICNHHAMKQV
jgi:hypothetical protein